MKMSYSDIKRKTTEREILEDEVKILQMAVQRSKYTDQDEDDTSDDDDDDSTQGKNFSNTLLPKY